MAILNSIVSFKTFMLLRDVNLELAIYLTSLFGLYALYYAVQVINLNASKYRIKKVVNRQGVKFEVQKRWLLFWLYSTPFEDPFDSEVEAERFIRNKELSTRNPYVYKF